MAKILLVDDNEPDRSLLARRLQRRGFDVVTAPDGEQALRRADADRPDLILMDLNMPVLDGWSATRRLRQTPGAGGAVPVIALTAYAADNCRDEALEAGCDDYDTKPIDLSRLLEKVEALLNRSGGDTETPAAGPAPPAAGAEVHPAPEPAAPRRERVAPAPHANGNGAAPGGHLLIVEDAADSRELMALFLRRQGYTVDTAEDGRAALARIDERPYDAVLLDVMMPGIDGVEVLRTIRRTRPAHDLPVIMVTAVGESAHIVTALTDGANDYVTKPLDMPVVLARVRTQLSLKRAVEQIRRLERGLEQRNCELQLANARMRSDLEAAAKVQASLLPARGPDVAGYRFAWLFNPSAALAGDILNVFRLDPRRVGLYVLDVAGHGVAAALLSVTVSRFLSPAPDSSSILWRQSEGSGAGHYELEPPERVAQRLSQRFPFDTVTEQFFTLLYGTLDVESHRLNYVSAGHPNLLHLPAGDATAPRILAACGLPIGVADEPYDACSIDLAPGDRLYIHTDGVTEAMSPSGDLFGQDRMLDALAAARHLPLEAGLERLCDEIDRWTNGAAPTDDQTVLAVERVP